MAELGSGRLFAGLETLYLLFDCFTALLFLLVLDIDVLSKVLDNSFLLSLLLHQPVIQGLCDLLGTSILLAIILSHTWINYINLWSLMLLLRSSTFLLLLSFVRLTDANRWLLFHLLFRRNLFRVWNSALIEILEAIFDLFTMARVPTMFPNKFDGPTWLRGIFSPHLWRTASVRDHLLRSLRVARHMDLLRVRLT